MIYKMEKINYDQRRNCFKEFSSIHSDLIWGDLSYVKSPWISYVIPVYKRPDLLKETLLSVLNQLPVKIQWDIVIVDNEVGEENDTEKMIRELNQKRILYYRNQKNLGVDGNYNRCIELARGKWIAMLHADDLITNDHLRLMSWYIKKYNRGRKPLAYISPRYCEFSNINKITLKRPTKSKYRKLKPKEQVLASISFRGRLRRFRQLDGALSGYSVSLPSFGTIMNRKIMIQEGGFNKNLGICEDVITPYKLAKKYRVYTTPKVMGYYRCEENESMKEETIFKIFNSMVDFREYMYQKNIVMRLWGKIARNELNRALVQYCVNLSRHGERKLKKDQFLPYYQYQEQSWLSLQIFKNIQRIYRLILGIGVDSFNAHCKRVLEISMGDILEKKRKNNRFIIYGAGEAGRYTIKYLKRKIADINIISCAVTKKEESEIQEFCHGIPIREITNLLQYRDKCTVIIATITPDYDDEMRELLKKYKFKSIISLIGEK